MGKQFSVEIKLMKPMTNKQVLACLKDCSGVYKKMEDVLGQFRGKSHSPLADKLVDFIFHYKDGHIAPDRWDYYEPVRQVVDAQTEEILKSALSQRCWIVLKRTRTPAMSCLIMNNELPDLTPTVDLINRSGGTSISIFPDRRRRFDEADADGRDRGGVFADPRFLPAGRYHFAACAVGRILYQARRGSRRRYA